MSKICVYLAGPITGCTKKEANNWRTFVSDALYDMDMTGVSPLRCEPIIGDVYAAQHEDNKFGTPQVIAAKNMMDVCRCDLTLAYIPYDVDEVYPQVPSVGTLQEIGWAVGMGKPVILVTDDGYVRNNVVIKATVPWRFRYEEGVGIDAAIDVISGLFAVYT